MSLKNLSTAAMVSVTSNWVKPGEERNLLQASKKLAPLLPDIEEAHRNLLATQPASDAPNKALAAIQAQEAEADALHDRKLRGLYNVFTGLADLADSKDDAAKHTELRDRLFPDGTAMVNQGYAAEAGGVELVQIRLTRDDRAFLRGVKILGTSLHDHVEQWLEAGKKLGELEQQRSTLPEAKGAVPADAVKARNGWIRVVNAVLANANLAKDLTDEDRAALFGMVQRLDAQSERGHARSTKAGDSKPAGSSGGAGGGGSSSGKPS